MNPSASNHDVDSPVKVSRTFKRDSRSHLHRPTRGLSGFRLLSPNSPRAPRGFAETFYKNRSSFCHKKYMRPERHTKGNSDNLSQMISINKGSRYPNLKLFNLVKHRRFRFAAISTNS